MQRHFLNINDIDLAEFASLCSQSVNAKDYPFSSNVQQKVVIYEGDYFRSLIGSKQAQDLKTELHHCLKDGPGVLVIRNAFPDFHVIDRATEVFKEIITDEKNITESRGDHFAKPGENERIWNALQKFCERDTDAFVAYYKNPVLRFVSEAWLGPFFQLTSQVNIIKPGGQAQQPHRDFHLGFQDDSLVAEFPIATQIFSQLLTLQGAVAHTDMNTSSGPTLLLPFSQQYQHGYLAWRNPEFIDYFQHNAVQLPLNKGDAVFFSPALFHAGGNNTESSDRIANLLQISSAFGKAMESVDRTKMTKLIYPVLLAGKQSKLLSQDEMKTVATAVVEGYPFPTNLDSDSPLAGSAPETVQALMELALNEEWTADRFCDCLNEATKRKLA